MEIFRLFGSLFVKDQEANDGLDRVDKKASGVGSKFEGLIGTAGKFGLALGALAASAAVALGVKGVTAADEFQKALNGLGAATGKGKEDLGAYEGILKNIYNANFGESFDDIGKSIATIAQVTGLSGQELEKTATSALLLRDTFEYEVADSVKAADSLMKQFGISSEEAYNLIAQGAQNGADRSGELLDSLNEYSPQFKALGFSADQFTNVLIDGAKNGAFQIDKVGDAVKEFNIRAKDGSKTSADAFQSLGLNAEKMSTQFAAGGQSAQQAFQTVIGALNNVKDPLELRRIGVELFGTQFEDLEASTVLALGNIGTTASATADTLQKINDVKYNTFGEAISGIGRQFETGVLIPIGQKVIPKLQELGTWFQSKMPEIQIAINDAMDGGIKLFDKLADSIKFVVDNANIFLPVLIGVTAAIAAQSIIGTIATLYEAWKAATVAQTTAQWLLNIAMDANPIGLIALAIGGLIAAGTALYMNWENLSTQAKVFFAILSPAMALIVGAIALYKNWGEISKVLADSWQWLKDKSVEIFNSILIFLGQWGSSLLAACLGIVQNVVVFFAESWNEIKTSTLEIWDSILEFFTKDVPEGFEKLIQFFKDLPGTVYEFLKDLFLEKIPYAIGYGIGFMIKALTEGIPKVIKFFEELPGKVWKWLLETIAQFMQWQLDMIEKAIEAGTEIIQTIIDFFAELPDKVKQWLDDTITRLTDWAGEAQTEAQTAGKGIIDGIIEFVENLPAKLAEWFVQANLSIIKFATDGLNAAKEVGSNIIDGIVQFVKDIPAKVDEYVGQTIKKITGLATKVKDAIANIFKSGAAGIEAGKNAAGGNNVTYDVPGYAVGTDYAPGGLSLVGEQGPELMNVPRGSRIYPADKTADILQQQQIVHAHLFLDGKEIAIAIAKPMNDLAKQRSREGGAVQL